MKKQKRKLEKKGLSDVVTTVLIILLALAAIAIVWAFVGPMIRNTSTSSELQKKCFDVEVRPTTCTIASGQATITYKSVRGEAAEVTGVIISNTGQTSSSTQTNSLSIFETGTMTFAVPTSGATFTAQVLPVVQVEDQKLTCDPSITIPCV